MSINDEIKEAFKEAQKSRSKAYAPYSKFQVASVIKLKGRKEWVSGVNVENASYGGTICAERSALVSAVSQFGGDIELEWVIITSSNPKEAIPPCGLCLQSLIEFGKPDLPIYLGNKDELLNKYTLKDLLPHSFQSEMIK